MEPRTVTITDETAYHSYLRAQACGWLLDLSTSCHDLANADVDDDAVESYAASVEALRVHLMESFITAFLPEASRGHDFAAEYDAAKKGTPPRA